VHGRLLEERDESRGHEVAVRDIGAVDVVPVREAVFLVVEHVLLHFLAVLGFGRDDVARHYPGVILVSVSESRSPQISSFTHDEDVKVVLLVGDRLVELGDVILARGVGGKGDDFARDALVVGLRHPLQLLAGAADDVNLGLQERQQLADFEMLGLAQLTPLTANAWVNMRPMPEPPPVISATLPLTPKSASSVKSALLWDLGSDEAIL